MTSRPRIPKAATAAVAAGLALVAPVAAGDAPCPRLTDGRAMPADMRTAEARAVLRCHVNAVRREHGRPPLEPDGRLNRTGQEYVGQMLDRRFFSHTSPGGRGLADRLQAAGWLPRHGRWTAGEALAWGRGRRSLPEATVEAWMDSPPHRRLLLDPRMREVGVGVENGNPRDADGPSATYALVLGRKY